MCLTINEYNFIKQVKDSSPFTCDQTLQEYIAGAKNRLAKWYGIEKVTSKMVYEYLKTTKNLGSE